MKKAVREIASVLMPIILGLIAVAVAMAVCGSGQYPYGSDTMTYLHKGNLVYQSIREGNWFPLYDSGWYNGVDVSHYGNPFSGYFLAFCQWIAGGNVTNGYLLFVGILFFLGSMVWLFIGKRKKRMFLGCVLGILWFFMPNNLYVLFFEGNLPRAFCLAVLPALVCFAYDYAREGKWWDLVRILLCFLVVTLFDFDFGIMCVVSLLLFTVISGVLWGKWRNSLQMLGMALISFLVTGLGTISYLFSSAGISKSETMENYFQNLLKTLNPAERYTSLNAYYYFGLAACLLALFGFLCSRRKSMPGFAVGIFLLLSTATALYPLMKVLPGSDYLLMCEYISIGLCFILYAFLTWDTLRKPILVLFCILLAADTIPSLNLVYGTMSGVSVAERFDEQDETTLIKEAKEISNQRIALFDGGELESMGAYLVSDYENGKAAAFGADYSSASTTGNVSQLNRALTAGFYPYVFDRCKELGNDTILIKLSQLDTYGEPVEKLDAAATANGYELAGESEFYRLYHLNQEGNWGTVTDYSAIGIGSGAASIALGFPAVEEVSETNLNDFTFEELSKYKTIYLSDFTYRDKEKAEDLIVKLSEAGVRIVILADGIPEDTASKAKEFLGVVCNSISFSNGYPLLDTVDGVLDCDLFPSGYEDWNTVYVSGLDETWGTVREDNLDLDFCGTVKNENIVVTGLNLTYFYALTKDEGVGNFLSRLTDLSGDELPEREIVPLNITYNNNAIQITSEKDNVNTTLAYHKIFRSTQNFEQENNLLYVNAGTTEITMKYPHLYIGLALTVLGILLAAAELYFARKNL